MSDQTREQFYDLEIAPAVLALCKQCQARGLSFAAHVEYAPAESGQTTWAAPDASFSALLVMTAMKARGNIDALIFAVLRHAKKVGHNSACLHILETRMATENS